MSEWGNPSRVMSGYPVDEYIVGRKRTRGTETSKYPQEKKEILDSQSSGERNGKSLNRAYV
jgi:hypothetical protein